MMSTEINIGIEQSDRQEIARGLSRLLADSYTLYLKTHNYHWNVKGPLFNTLHQMFEEQYTELAMAVDEIAERIRALGEPAPGSYKAYAALTSIEEEDAVPDAEEMIRQLLKGQETVARTARARRNGSAHQEPHPLHRSLDPVRQPATQPARARTRRVPRRGLAVVSRPALGLDARWTARAGGTHLHRLDIDQRSR